MGGKKKAMEGDGTSAKKKMAPKKKKQAAGQKKQGALAPVAGGAAMQDNLKYSKMTLKELQEKFLLDGRFLMALHDINVVHCTCLDTHTHTEPKTDKTTQTQTNSHTQTHKCNHIHILPYTHV